MLTKSHYRRILLEKRKALPLSRRKEAARALFSTMQKVLGEFSSVLSFASLPEEIDTWDLNAHLAQEKKLLLPKRKGDLLAAYAVEDLQKDLVLTEDDLKIWEPLEELSPIPLEKIGCVLVPGLGFDPFSMRIGYGKGYYDRLLALLPPSCKKIGIGFSEQGIDKALPREPHDQPIDLVYLF
eukprot:Opistho-1_new@101389